MLARYRPSLGRPSQSLVITVDDTHYTHSIHEILRCFPHSQLACPSTPLRVSCVLVARQIFSDANTIYDHSWSVGSALFLASFAAVMGPLNYVYHLLSGPRIPFTAAYFGSIILTLVFAIKVSALHFWCLAY